MIERCINTIQYISLITTNLGSRSLPLHRKHNFDTHIFSSVHNLSVNDDLIGTDLVSYSISWIRGRGDLNLTPLAVRRNQVALGCAVLEFPVDALFIDATLALDQG